jgi:hypothetical protein
MAKGVPRPVNFIGKKGRSGRKKIGEEVVDLAKARIYTEVLREMLPDIELAKKHLELLNATGIDHMTFPLDITDDEIKELLREVNCEMRKVQRSNTLVNVWCWSIDNNARKNALDMLYKLRGDYAIEKKEVKLFNISNLLDEINEPEVIEE